MTRSRKAVVFRWSTSLWLSLAVDVTSRRWLEAIFTLSSASDVQSCYR